MTAHVHVAECRMLDPWSQLYSPQQQWGEELTGESGCRLLLWLSFAFLRAISSSIFCLFSLTSYKEKKRHSTVCKLQVWKVHSFQLLSGPSVRNLVLRWPKKSYSQRRTHLSCLGCKVLLNFDTQPHLILGETTKPFRQALRWVCFQVLHVDVVRFKWISGRYMFWGENNYSLLWIL